MPWAQTEAALQAQLGADWRSKVASFEDKPFAAASIGQVHMAALHDGRQVGWLLNIGFQFLKARFVLIVPVS